jgi:hypothetical protein
MNINFVYKGIRVRIHGLEMRVDLLLLKLYDFEVILGMDWLSKYKAYIDCFTKTMTLQGLDRKRAIFGEKKNHTKLYYFSNEGQETDTKRIRGVSCLHERWGKGSELLADILIVKEFPDVFPEELPRLPPKMKVKVSIDIILRPAPIAQLPLGWRLRN